MSVDGASSYLSTATVAEALGVGVSTVKRWVDDGVLAAHKTAGGHRKLLVADVLDLARRSDLPHADLSRLMPAPRTPRATSATELADPLHQALLAADADRVRLLLLGSYRNGVAIEEIADLAIAPAMQRIGHDWETGRIEVFDEHRATQVCVAALHEIKTLLENRAGKDRPRAVGGAAERDWSILPTLLAQMTLLDCGWEAINLGPNTPFASLSRGLRDLRPRLLWLSASHVDSKEGFVAGYRRLYREAKQAEVAVVLGGRILAEGLHTRAPCTLFGSGMRDLAAFARTMHSPSKVPRRGRPRGT